MSRATFKRMTTAIAERTRERDLPLEPFTVHDLRRTAPTLLHEMGFNSDWIEKGLAHEERSSRGVYNKAEFEAQRWHMAQEWSNAVDAWEAGRAFTPVLVIPETAGPRFDPRL